MAYGGKMRLGRDLEKDVVVLNVYEQDGRQYVKYMRRGVTGKSLLKSCEYGNYFLARGARVYMSDLYKG